jgi:hypothetical protein
MGNAASWLYLFSGRGGGFRLVRWILFSRIVTPLIDHHGIRCSIFCFSDGLQQNRSWKWCSGVGGYGKRMQFALFLSARGVFRLTLNYCFNFT